jgi:hypothetical protein
MPSETGGEGRQRSLQVRGPRAVALALEVLQRRHDVVVSYEDPVYVKDGTANFLSNLEKPAVPGLADAVRVPQAVEIQVSYEVDERGAPVHLQGILENILGTFNAQRVAGILEYEAVGERLVVCGAPRLMEIRPLDYEVVVEQRRWTGWELLRHIARSVRTQAGIGVFNGMAPPNLLARQLEFGGRGKARDLLHDALTTLAQGLGTAGYEAFYDHMLGWYMINIKASPFGGGGPVECSDRDIPSGETSKGVAQEDDDYAWNFEMQLQGGGNHFDGRTVKEWGGKVCDACFFPGSCCTQFSVLGSQWVVVGHQYGYDAVGIQCKCKDVYMAYHNNQPCSMEAEQIMTILKGNNWCHYTTNILRADVSPLKVTVTRGTASQPIPSFKCDSETGDK